jgi:hypothetical protein
MIKKPRYYQARLFDFTWENDSISRSGYMESPFS